MDDPLPVHVLHGIQEDAAEISGLSLVVEGLAQEGARILCVEGEKFVRGERKTKTNKNDRASFKNQ